MISIYAKIALCSWLGIFTVWLPGAFMNKRTAKYPHAKKFVLTTIMIYASFLLLFDLRMPDFFEIIIMPRTAFFGILGDTLAILGVAFAIWARLKLGRNWSGKIATIKEGHELVTGGPYRFVRHPIYTGFFFAMLGTALTIGTLSAFLGAAVGLAAFLIRISIEEKIMTDTFPDRYPAYKARSKTLIPFVW